MLENILFAIFVIALTIGLLVLNSRPNGLDFLDQERTAKREQENKHICNHLHEHRHGE